MKKKKKFENSEGTGEKEEILLLYHFKHFFGFFDVKKTISKNIPAYANPDYFNNLISQAESIFPI